MRVIFYIVFIFIFFIFFFFFFFFFNDTATTEIYTLSLHDALPIRWARTSGTEATALTALETARLRIAPDTSAPLTAIAGRRGSVPTSITGCRACAATTAGSVTSSCWVISHQVSARYMAPVSR